MPCYSPILAYHPRDGSASRQFVFKSSEGNGVTVKLPCGSCVGCRLERSRQWALRCMHEAKMHPENCFITLTYNDLHLPDDRSLNYEHFQLFMKRLRKMIRDEDIRAAGDGVPFFRKVRFYMCGEYGEKLGRPHFHACIFGYNFPDRKFWQKTSSKSSLDRSAILESLWPYGYSSVGNVTFESAAYVARYIMKKVGGDAADEHYMFCRSLHRGDIQSPSRVYKNVFKARHRCALV
jgi:hypothetical protein